MRRLTGFYILLIIFIASFAAFTHFHYSFLLTVINFPPLLHKIFESIYLILLILLFLKANQIYSETKEKRMVILAGGFLIAGLLDFYHLIVANSFPYDFVIIDNIHKKPELFYLIVKKLILPITFFISVLYTGKVTEKEAKYYRLKTYLIFFCVTIFAIFPYQLITILFLNTHHYKIYSLNISFNIISETLYFLTAFLYADLLIKNNKKIFCPLIAGLILLGVSQLFRIGLLYPLEIFEIIAHVLKITGYALILWGFKDLKISANLISFRQKLLAYVSVFLILLYLIFVSLSNAIFNIRLPFFQNLFLLNLFSFPL